MIRLLIKEYSLQEKVALWRALLEVGIDARCDGAPEIVTEDIFKACDWLKAQIDKEGTGNAQNR